MQRFVVRYEVQEPIGTLEITRQIGDAPVPIRDTLVRIGDAQEQRLRKWPAPELKGDGKAVRRESRRYAQCRDTEEIGRPVVARYHLDTRDVVGRARRRLGDRRHRLRVHRGMQEVDAAEYRVDEL